MNQGPGTSSGSSKRTPSEKATAGRVWRVEISGQPQLQRSKFGHWSARFRHDKDWQERVAWRLRAMGVRGSLLLPRVAIECTRYGSGREPDHDNLVISFKPLVDALKPCGPSNPNGVGLILDDSPAVIARQTYLFQKVTRHAESVVLLVTELSSDT